MTPTEYCQLVESRLGWLPPEGLSYRRYQQEARKVTTKQQTNPALFTFDNLRLAVELLAREKKTRTPIGVFAHVQRALDLAQDTETDLEIDIRAAMRVEAHRGDPDGWVDRFARAVGPYRAEALAAWRALQ